MQKRSSRQEIAAAGLIGAGSFQTILVLWDWATAGDSLMSLYARLPSFFHALEHPLAAPIVLAVGFIWLYVATRDTPKAVQLYGPDYNRPLPKKKHPVLQFSIGSALLAGLGAAVYIAHHGYYKQQSETSTTPRPAGTTTAQNAPPAITTPSSVPKAPKRKIIAAPTSDATAISKKAQEPTAPPSVEPQPTKTPPVPSSNNLWVTGIVKKGERPEVTVDGVRLNYTAKAPGTTWIVLLVSTRSRRNSIEPSTVQAVFDALRKLPKVTVFFANGGYQVSLAGAGTGVPALSENESEKSICIYNKTSADVARQVKLTMEGIVDIKVPAYCTALRRDFGLGVTYQQVLEESGVDVEVML
jgi:hypothetical protein